MRKLIIIVAVLSFSFLAALGLRALADLMSPPAHAAVTATLANPVDYTSQNWRSICLYNRDSPTGQYRGEIVWEPRDSANGQKAPALSSSRTTATLPTGYQSFVNTWIGFARADFPAFN